MRFNGKEILNYEGFSFDVIGPDFFLRWVELTIFCSKMEVVNGEWRFNNSLDQPIPALYVQFIPEEAGKHLNLSKLQIYGCRLGESLICLHIFQFLT